jgi:predicted aspartyl protease
LKKCGLTETEKVEYVATDGTPEIPVLEVTLTRPDMEESVQTKAIIDTGFDEAMLISREVRDELVRSGIKPDDHDSLDAGAYEIPCEVYLLQVKVANRWFRIRGYHAVVGEYETLIGRMITNQLTVCLRGTEKKTVIAKR